MRKRIVVVPLLALGIAFGSGPAWAESTLSSDADVTTDAIAVAFGDVRDALSAIEAPSPLRSLLSVIAGQIGSLAAQLSELYDDLFVDTCPTCDG